MRSVRRAVPLSFDLDGASATAPALKSEAVRTPKGAVQVDVGSEAETGPTSLGTELNAEAGLKGQAKVIKAPEPVELPPDVLSAWYMNVDPSELESADEAKIAAILELRRGHNEATRTERNRLNAEAEQRHQQKQQKQQKLLAERPSQKPQAQPPQAKSPQQWQPAPALLSPAVPHRQTTPLPNHLAGKIERLVLPKPPAPLCAEFGERLFPRVIERLRTTHGDRLEVARLAPKVTSALLTTKDAGSLLPLLDQQEMLRLAVADAAAALKAAELKAAEPKTGSGKKLKAAGASRSLHSPVSITTAAPWQRETE